jgi:hypothetical protein
VNDQRCHVNFFAGFVVISLALVLSGCGVGVPSKASVNVRRVETARVDEGVMVSLGPRELLERLSKEIVSNNKKIEVVDGLLFRDTAFPEGDWTLERLLAPEVRSRVGDVLRVDYLVLLGTPESTSGEEEGFFIPMAVGALSVEGSTKISASIIDLKTGKLVTQIDSVASGKGHILYYVIIVVGNEPQTVTGAIDGLAKEIGDEIGRIRRYEKVRIAVMAIEEMDAESERESIRLTTKEALREEFEEGNELNPKDQLSKYYNLVEVDIEFAHKWLCRSSDQENPDAQFRVAQLFELGWEKLPQDFRKAYVYYRLAARSGHALGKTNASRLEEELTIAGDLAEAKRMLRDWNLGDCQVDLNLSMSD